MERNEKEFQLKRSGEIIVIRKGFFFVEVLMFLAYMA